MRKLSAIFLSLSLGAIAHANAEQNQAFECMDKSSFAVDSQCMSNKISQNIEFREMQVNLANQANVSGENALATLKFYPKDMLIEVVAHRDADNQLTASVEN